MYHSFVVNSNIYTKGQKKETLPEKISVHNLAISVYFNPKHMF